MKRGKKITRDMKIMLSKNGYDPTNFMYTKNTPHTVEFVHKITGARVLIEK